MKMRELNTHDKTDIFTRIETQDIQNMRFCVPRKAMDIYHLIQLETKMEMLRL